jgi:hypothetical protein
MEQTRAIMKARKTWNAAAQKSRGLTEDGAAEELYAAASAVLELLRPFVETHTDVGDDDSEAGFGDHIVDGVYDDDL